MSNKLESILDRLLKDHKKKMIIVKDSEAESWYRTRDILEILDHSNTQNQINALESDVKREWSELMNSVPAKIKGMHKNLQPETIFISEPGLYDLLLTSKSDAAQEFQKWVFAEVLPSIASIGSYGVGETDTESSDSEESEEETQTGGDNASANVDAGASVAGSQMFDLSNPALFQEIDGKVCANPFMADCDNFLRSIMMPVADKYQSNFFTKH